MKRRRAGQDEEDEQEQESVAKRRRVNHSSSESNTSSDEQSSGDEIRPSAWQTYHRAAFSSEDASSPDGESDESVEVSRRRSDYDNSSTGDSNDETGSDENASTDLITLRKQLRFKNEPRYDSSSDEESENERPHRQSEEYDEDAEEEDYDSGNDDYYVARRSFNSMQYSSVGGKTLPGRNSTEAIETIVISSSDDEKESGPKEEAHQPTNNKIPHNTNDFADDTKTSTATQSPREESTSHPENEEAINTDRSNEQSEDLQNGEEQMEIDTEGINSAPGGSAEPKEQDMEEKEESVQSSVVEETVVPEEKNVGLSGELQKNKPEAIDEQVAVITEAKATEQEEKESTQHDALDLPALDLPAAPAIDRDNTVLADQIPDQQTADDVLAPVEGVSMDVTETAEVAEPNAPETSKVAEPNVSETSEVAEPNAPETCEVAEPELPEKVSTPSLTDGVNDLQSVGEMDGTIAPPTLPEKEAESLPAEEPMEIESEPRSKYVGGRWGLATEILESFGVHLSVPLTHRRGMQEAVSAMCQLIEEKQRLGYISPAEQQEIQRARLESIAPLRARVAAKEQEHDALKIIEEDHRHKVQVLHAKLQARDLLQKLLVLTERI